MLSTREFLEITNAGNDRWRMPIVGRAVGGGGNSLFGGVGLAAGIVALEAASDRPVIWATGQYLSRVGEPAVLEMDVELPAAGRSITQGRIRGHSAGREVITVIGATGRRPPLERHVFERMPTVPPPEECEAVLRQFEHESVHDHVEIRLAHGIFGFNGQGVLTSDGLGRLWARMPEVVLDAASLALMADYMASAVGNSIGRIVHCTSLDNTIRFAAPREVERTGWVLCDTRIDAVGDGLAHGTCQLWSQDGTLLATASQSMAISIEADVATGPVAEVAERGQM
jgi:acyl-CoA thioesterase II